MRHREAATQDVLRAKHRSRSSNISVINRRTATFAADSFTSHNRKEHNEGRNEAPRLDRVVLYQRLAVVPRPEAFAEYDDRRSSPTGKSERRTRPLSEAGASRVAVGHKRLVERNRAERGRFDAWCTNKLWMFCPSEGVLAPALAASPCKTQLGVAGR